MTLRNWISASLGIAGLMIAPALAQPIATPQPTATPQRNPCFMVSQFENWRAPDRRTINIRVRGNHYFRLGLGYECFALRSPGARLITTFRGSNTVCSPLDWDLRVSEGIGSPSEPCIVKTMTELSPAEVAALPPKAKP